MRHRWNRLDRRRRVCDRCRLLEERRATARPKVYGRRPVDTLYFRGKEYLGKNVRLPPCLDR